MEGLLHHPRMVLGPLHKVRHLLSNSNSETEPLSGTIDNDWICYKMSKVPFGAEIIQEY